jgi:signal transduction histidine kinase
MAVTRDAEGELTLRATPQLAKLRSDVPDLWFVVRDRQGHSLSEGAVPPEFARIGDALDQVGQARLGWNLGDTPKPTARVKWIDTPVGNVQFVTGPGGQVPLGRVVRAVSLVFLVDILPVLVVMSLATFIATPIAIRRALASLDEAAAKAERIDIDQHGTRLPIENVPAEVRPLVNAVNDALARFDEGYERHKRFLMDAAHELRTPIAILRTRLESLSRSEEKTRLIEDVARLSTLAEQLLDLQRLNQYLDRFDQVDLVEIGRAVAADLAPLAIAAGYQMSFEPEVEQVAVMGDQNSLERALTNLVQNALDHGGRQGTVTITVRSNCVIEVTDEGAGIPIEHRERIFEPFYRLTSSDRGTGLGLNLVQEIVRLHRGSVTVLDGPSGGACFRITLPLF